MTARKRIVRADLAGVAIHWIVACGAGPLLGSWLFSAVLLRWAPAALFPHPFLLVVVRSLTIGCLMGAAQTRVLSPSVAKTSRWIAATTAGFTLASIGASVANLTLDLLPAPEALGRLAEAAVLLLAGTLMGAIQSRALGRPSAEWALAVGVGWLVGALLPSLVPGMAPFAYTPNPVSQALWGVGVGLATLAPLARRTPSSA